MVLFGCDVEAGQSKLKETAERMCDRRGGAIGLVMAEPGEWNVVCDDDSTFGISESSVMAGMKNGELYVIAGFVPDEAEEE